MIKKILSLLTLIICLCSVKSSAESVSFTDTSSPMLKVDADKNSGLSSIYIVRFGNELREMRINGAPAGASVMVYQNLGGGYAEPIDFSIDSNSIVVSQPILNAGYIVQAEGKKAFCFWVVDYSSYPFNISSVTVASEQNCDNTMLDISGQGAAIHYYSVDGRQCELSRDIALNYYTLEYDERAENFVQVSKTKILQHLSPTISITPPIYCHTDIKISGDRFMEQWGTPINYTSQSIAPSGVNVYTTATQLSNGDDDEEADASNLINADSQGLGGSAPAVIEFRAYTTDAVIHNEWQFASDPDFEYITHRFNDQNLDYTFMEEGTIYVRFVGSNADGSCEAYGETYTVHIGASDLRIPNAFTPNGDGVNDVWKVAYRSLVSFKCSIFDRYGNQIFTFSDPSQGWDGKHNGKFVKSGVYYYVIEATGADGKKYKKGGDINIINSKRYSSGSASGE